MEIKSKELKMKFKEYLTENKVLNADRGSIIQIKKSKWEVFRKIDDYTFWVYKVGTKNKKAYELSNVGGNTFEVWETGGSGQKLKDKPFIKGEANEI